ncbi:MAG: hypothetical protein ABIA74_01480 [bacterium]
MFVFSKKFKNVIVFAFACLFAKDVLSINPAGVAQLANSEKGLDYYNDIADLYLPTLAAQEKEELEAQMKVINENSKLKVGQEFKKKPIKIGSVETLRLFYHILSGREAGNKNIVSTKKEQNILNKNVFNDLNVFCGDKSDLNKNLFKHIDNTVTTAGKIELQKILFLPTANIQELKKRQEIIRLLVKDEKLFNFLEKELDQIKKNEHELAWFWKVLEDGKLSDFSRELYFNNKMFKGVNNQQTPMEFKHDIINMQILPAAVPSIASMGTVFWFGWTIAIPLGAPWVSVASVAARAGAWALGFNLLFNGAFKMFGVNNIYDNANANYERIKWVHNKMSCVAELEGSVQNISNKTLNYDVIKNMLPGLVQDDVEVNKFFKTLSTRTFKKKYSMFSLNGKILAAYKKMYEVKDQLISQLRSVGRLDAYMSIAKLFKKYEKKENAKYSFVEYLELDKPTFEIKEFWHPELDVDKVITNNLEIGKTNRNIILTGPNAGGKSTVLKAITINLIFAQSFGIAPANQIKLTPFTLMNTYLNITDAVGQESLFQAEMNRAKKLIDMVSELQPNQFSFIIMDEVFTGTNPEEGSAAAYGILKKLSRLNHHLSINATHFVTQLGRLEKDTDGVCKNYKVYVNKDEYGNIKFTYKLEQGLTDQKIALDLLRQSGFDSDILREAHEAMNNNKVVESSVAA